MFSNLLFKFSAEGEHKIPTAPLSSSIFQHMVEKVPFLFTLNLSFLFPHIPPTADTEKILQVPKNWKIMILLHPLE